MGEIVVLRHGQTEWSRSGQHTSVTDLPLLPEGEEQARGLRTSLADRSFAEVWVSPRQRARQTAELAVWQDTEADWTLVRPPRLVDGPATGRVDHDASVSTRSTVMRRGDLAVFLTDVLEQGLYCRQAPFVATADPRR